MSPGSKPASLDPRFIAGIDMLRRTGASSVEIRFSEPDEGSEGQTPWLVIASWTTNPATGDELPTTAWEVAAGRDPTSAAMRLLAQVIDGGRCKHCDRPTGFSEDLHPLPLGAAICWYQWDPELSTFRRSCEGET